MKKNYVSIKKQTKKAQREYYSKNRKDWGTVNPVSVTFNDARKFNKASRSRVKAALRQGREVIGDSGYSVYF